MGNWKEDFGHENGNYENICIDCGDPFIGHKRRQVCKSCAYDSVKADLQRHKDALDRVAYQAQCIKDATDMGQQQWERQALYAMFTESGGYIWPIETGEDE